MIPNGHEWSKIVPESSKTVQNEPKKGQKFKIGLMYTLEPLDV